MRKFLFLAVTLSLTCFAQERKLPDHIRLVPKFVGPALEPPEQPKANEAQNLTAQVRCAHIIAYKPDPNIDGKMVIGGGQTHSGAMRVITPPPVCPEDVRELPSRSRRPVK
jgi:hypothetical protein